MSPFAKQLLFIALVVPFAGACVDDEPVQNTVFTMKPKAPGQIEGPSACIALSEAACETIPTVPISRLPLKCDDAKEVSLLPIGDEEATAPEASGFATYPGTNGKSSLIVSNYDTQTPGQERGLLIYSDFVNPDGTANSTVQPVGVKLPSDDQLIDVESLAVIEMPKGIEAAGAYPYLLILFDTQKPQKLFFYGFDPDFGKNPPALLRVADVLFPAEFKDQFGRVTTNLADLSWTIAIHPIDLTIWLINKAVNEYGLGQVALLPTLLGKIDLATWQASLNTGFGALVTMYARVPLEVMVGMDMREKEVTEKQKLLEMLPTDLAGLSLVSKMLFDENLLATGRDASLEALMSEIDQIKQDRAFDQRWPDVVGTMLDASKHPALQLVATGLKFVAAPKNDGAAATEYYLAINTYNGPMFVDIDVNKPFPTVGEIVMLDRHRYLGLPTLTQMETLEVVPVMGEKNKISGSLVLYSTEANVQSNLGTVKIDKAPIMAAVCKAN